MRMNVIEAICLATMAITGVVLALHGPKYEDLLEKFFLFCIVILVGMFFSDLISKCK
jgi:hypothetical protein